MGETPMIDEVTVRAVCEYLHLNFGGGRVVPFVEQGIQGFRVEDVYGTPVHVLAVDDEFFRDHPVGEIPGLLSGYRVAEIMRGAGRTVVEVTNAGARVTDPTERHTAIGRQKRW